MTKSFIGIFVLTLILSSCSPKENTNRGYVISQTQIESEISLTEQPE